MIFAFCARFPAFFVDFMPFCCIAFLIFSIYPPYNLSEAQGELVIRGGELKPGMYLYSLIVGGQVQDTKRMVVTR